MRRLFTFIVFVCLMPVLSAYGVTPCAELNSKYLTKYVADFSINLATFEIDPAASPLFSCDGFDKNYILARAINDLDILRPVSSNQPDYYALVSQTLKLDGTSVRYFSKLKNFPGRTARTVHDGELAAIFLLDNYMNSSERIRPTYTLVHEARHTLKGKPGYANEPGHVACMRGKNRGERACDQLLAKEDVLIAGSGNSYEFLFLLTLRDHPKASALMKKEAQEQLNYLATNLFNEIEPGILKYYRIELQ